MKASVLFLLTVIHLAALSQNVFEPLHEPYCFNTELIHENHIRSLHVFAQFVENGTEEDIEERVQIKSFEFDEDGYLVYEIQNEKSIVSPVIWDMNEGIEFNLYKYNNHKQKIYTYFENARWNMESFFKYDENLNLSELESTFCGETFEKVKFKWRNGEMVKSKVMHDDDYDERIYNEDGKIIQEKAFGDTYTYEYQKSGDTNSYSETHYHQDSLISVKHFSYLGESKSRMTHFLWLNNFDDRMEVFVSYDEQGNTTDYHFQEFEKSLDDNANDIDNEAMYKIKNEYDERGLLVKQIFYLRDESTQLMEFDKVLYYEYETSPLENKLTPGSVGKVESTIQLR